MHKQWGVTSPITGDDTGSNSPYMPGVIHNRLLSIAYNEQLLVPAEATRMQPGSIEIPAPGSIVGQAPRGS